MAGPAGRAAAVRTVRLLHLACSLVLRCVARVQKSRHIGLPHLMVRASVRYDIQLVLCLLRGVFAAASVQ